MKLMKTCSHCNEQKALDEFAPRAKTGRDAKYKQSHCRFCDPALQRERRERYARINGMGHYTARRVANPLSYAASRVLSAAKHFERGDVRRTLYYLHMVRV